MTSHESNWLLLRTHLPRQGAVVGSQHAVARVVSMSPPRKNRPGPAIQWNDWLETVRSSFASKPPVANSIVSGFALTTVAQILRPDTLGVSFALGQVAPVVRET